MHETILVVSRMIQHPIMTVKTLRHMLKFRNLLKKEGYRRPLREDIWFINYSAGFMIAQMRDGSRVTYNTRTCDILA